MRSPLVPKTPPSGNGEAARPARPPLLTDQAYDLIRRDIIHCELAPGSEVTEAELALRLGLGKGPVRAALGRLCQEGLVSPLPRRGYEIAPITLRDVHEILEMRLLLEPAATAMAAGKIGPETLRRITATSSAASGARFAVDHDINRNFHVTILRSCGNARVADAVAGLIDQMERILRIFTRNRAPEKTRAEYVILQTEHERIMKALSAGDAAAAEAHARDHLETTRSMIMDLITRRSEAWNTVITD
ncbi:MAG: GntR family transcriptional regulator [Rhodospirillales bacterium]